MSAFRLLDNKISGCFLCVLKLKIGKKIENGEGLMGYSCCDAREAKKLTCFYNRCVGVLFFIIFLMLTNDK